MIDIIFFILVFIGMVLGLGCLILSVDMDDSNHSLLIAGIFLCIISFGSCSLFII